MWRVCAATLTPIFKLPVTEWPLFLFYILLSPNDPIFKMLSHLINPFFRNIYRWKWASCSHWMTPIFTNKRPPRDMYPIFVWPPKWPPFFRQTEVFTKRPLLFFIVLTKWPPIFLLSSLKDHFFSLFSLSPKDPYFGVVSAHTRHFHMWMPPVPYMSLP